MESAVHLLTVLIAAWVFGHVAEFIKIPAAVGQVMAGVVLAMTSGLVPEGSVWLYGIAADPAVQGVGEAGIIMLLLYAGIEMRPSDIAKHEREAFAVAIGGVAVPLALGFALAWVYLPESAARGAQAFVVGVALSISAIAVAAKVFMDFRLMHQAIGQISIAAAVIDDIIGLILLGVVTELIAKGAPPDALALLLMLGKVTVFFAATWAIGHFLFEHLWRALHKIHMPGLRLMTLLTIALGYGLFAELLGLHFILGPFMAGLYFEPQRVGHAAFNAIDHTVNTVTKGVLGPVFFAAIGLMVDLSALVEVPGFLAALVVVAIVGKLIGCGLPAYVLNGGRARDAVAIGIGMSGRGAVELFIVSIAYETGLFGTGNGGDPILANLYSALVLTAIITTALTPVLLRIVLQQSRPAGGAADTARRTN
ncbi:MAG: cation:proton antiporter [Rhodospirillales bacterium]|nr:cation:proton antiporter [Rhodospirillales bacterium]MBO6785238.1 cation:proton antiporter [Rhodospirillales bacterium]